MNEKEIPEKEIPDSLVDRVQLLARRSALKLEIKGLTRRGRSAYAICKEVYGLKGSKEKVLEQMNELVNNLKGEVAE